MAPTCYKMYKQCFTILILVLLYQTEAKPKGGRRTGGGGSKYSNTGTSHRHTQTHNTGYNSGNSGHHDSVHQSQSYNTGNSHPVVPSAPVGGPGQHQIGFERFNNNQHGGGGGGGAGPQNPHGIGFDNVNRQNSQHPYNVNQHNNHGTGHRNSSGGGGGGGYYGGYNNNHGAGYRNNSGVGGGGYNNHNQRFNSSSNVPLNSGHPPSYPGGNNYYHQGGGGYHSPYIAPNPPGGYHNPNFAQPQTYYQQYHPAPNMPPPQIYQPYQQQSSGGSALGYVGSLAGGLAGGYLIGRLTSGGGSGHSSNTITNNNYEVHHYYHNSNEVPKQLSVSNSSLATCAPNATQGLCVPNTFPVCLFNGTIMCVTHTIYTTPCVGLNTTSACVISLVPACAGGDPKCNGTTNTTAMYIPCLSNVTLTNPGSGNVVAPSSGTTGTNLVGDKVEFCVTAIAEPKFPPPPQMVNNQQQPQYNMGYQPPYQAAAQPPLTKASGTKESLSGWALMLMIVLFVGVK